LSALIVAFLGGVRWGVALPIAGKRNLGLAIAPTILAFGCLQIEPQRAILLLALIHAVLAGFDALRAATIVWPVWYKRLRVKLGLAVCALHVLLHLALRQLNAL
jgi:hypothetical protein